MKSLATALIVLALLALGPVGAQAAKSKAPEKAPEPAPSSDQVKIPDPPQPAAKAYLLVDHNSGTVLAESNADARLEPASLTKIMTAYVVFRELARGNITLKDEVLISEKAWRTSGSKMFVELGKRIAIEDLLKGMIIQSGNDASVALAEHAAGSEATFAELMNNHAQRLGMTNSHFMNADGLSHPEHYTSARDLALVTAATIREFPDYYAWYAVKEFVYHGIKQQNRNMLLSQDDSVDGVKTGHTEAAGYCLVASAKRDDMRLTSVILGSGGTKARAEASLALLNYGFRFYEDHKLYPGGQAVETLRIWKGEIKELPVGPADDLYATIPRGQGQSAKLSAHLEKNPDVFAPVAKGDTVGQIIVNMEDKEIRRVPLVALQDVAEGGWWAKLRDTILRWF